MASKQQAEEENRRDREKKDKISAEVRRGYMELGLDFSRQDEASLGPLKLKQYLDTSGKLYAQVNQVQEAVYDARMLTKIARLSLDKTTKMSTNAIQFNSNEYADRLMEKMKGNRANISRRRLYQLGKEVKSLFNRSPALHYLNGALGFIPPPTKEKRHREPSKLRPTKISELVSTQASVVDTTELSESKQKNFAQRIGNILTIYYKSGGKKALNYFRFVLDPNSFATSIENMFHVSFLVKEGSVMIFMENGIPMIKPMKKNKPSASGSKAEGNQVVVNMTMHEWERIVAALRLTKAMIPPPGQEKRVLDEIN